jgi:hypothetical protein
MPQTLTCLLVLLFSISSPAMKGNVEIWHSTLAALSHYLNVWHPDGLNARFVHQERSILRCDWTETSWKEQFSF